MTALLAEVAKLSIAEKRELLVLLKESIAAEEGDAQENADELNDEFDRHIAYDRANPNSGRPWAEVKADILKRLR